MGRRFADLESLLTSHVKTLMKTPRPLELFIYGASGGIGFTCCAFVFLSAIAGVLWTFSSFVDSYQGKLKAISDSTTHQADQLIIFKDRFPTRDHFLRSMAAPRICRDRIPCNFICDCNLSRLLGQRAGGESSAQLRSALKGS
jgi:hypothetical protein